MPSHISPESKETIDAVNPQTTAMNQHLSQTDSFKSTPNANVSSIKRHIHNFAEKLANKLEDEITGIKEMQNSQEVESGTPAQTGKMKDEHHSSFESHLVPTIKREEKL